MRWRADFSLRSVGVIIFLEGFARGPRRSSQTREPNPEVGHSISRDSSTNRHHEEGQSQ